MTKTTTEKKVMRKILDTTKMKPVGQDQTPPPSVTEQDLERRFGMDAEGWPVLREISRVGTATLELTELGREISEEIGAKGMAERFAAGLAEEKIEGKTPYEIQILCLNYLLNILRVCQATFLIMNFCAIKYGVSIKNIRKIIAIELRDLPLAEGIEARSNLCS